MHILIVCIGDMKTINLIPVSISLTLQLQPIGKEQLSQQLANRFS